MNTLTISVIFGISLVILPVLVADGLKCYLCSMTTCDDDLDDMVKVDCMNGVCTKTSDQSDDEKVLSRGCSKTGTTPGCSNTNNTKICVCKDEDLCNGSVQVNYTATWSIFLLIVVPFIHRFV